MIVLRGERKCAHHVDGTTGTDNDHRRVDWLIIAVGENGPLGIHPGALPLVILFIAVGEQTHDQRP